MLMHILRPMLMAFQHVFKRTFTVKHPYTTVRLAGRYRGRLMLKDIKDCIGCGVCAWICPTKAISLVTVNGRRLPSFDLGRCCVCGLCVEKCPRPLMFTQAYELSAYERNDFIYSPDRLATSPVEERRKYVSVKDMNRERLVLHG